MPFDYYALVRGIPQQRAVAAQRAPVCSDLKQQQR